MIIAVLSMVCLAVFMGIVIFTIHLGMKGIDAKTKKLVGMGFLMFPVALLAIILLILAVFFQAVGR